MNDGVLRRPRVVHVAAGVTGAVLAGALLVTVVGRVAGFSRIGDALRDANFVWLIVCVAGQAVVFAGYAGAMRHAIAAEGGPTIPVALALRLVFASFAATQLFAFAGAAGMAIVYWALRRLGLPRAEAAVRLIGLSTAVYLVFAVLGWGAALWAGLDGSAPVGMVVPWLAGVPLVIVAARWFTSPARISRWTVDGASGGLPRRALGTGVGAAAWVRRMSTSPEGRPVFAWALCYWVGDIASLWGALHAFGARPPLAALALVYVTGYLVQSLPIPLIATGGVDAATTVLLDLVGVGLDVALLGVVAHRIFAFWIPVIPGSVLALTLRRTGKALDASATPSP